MKKYGAHAVGLTLSENQYAYIYKQLEMRPVRRGQVDVHLCGWEEYDEPVDRIVSIGAFEHFRIERHGAFFGKW